MSSNIYHHTHLRPAFINTAIQRRTPPHYTQNLHKNRADRTPLHTRTTPHQTPSRSVQRRIRSTKQPIRAAKRHQTAQQRSPRNPRPPPRIEPRRTHHAEPNFPNLLPPTRALPLQKIFFAEFIPYGDMPPQPSPTNRRTPKRRQKPCYTAVVGGKPAKEKPSAATDGRKEVSTMEYVVVFRGKRYEFPTWSEMMEFKRDHGISD